MSSEHDERELGWEWTLEHAAAWRGEDKPPLIVTSGTYNFTKPRIVVDARWKDRALVAEQRADKLEEENRPLGNLLGEAQRQQKAAKQRMRELEQSLEQERTRRGFGERHGLPQQLLECEEALRTSEQFAAELEHERDAVTKSALLASDLADKQRSTIARLRREGWRREEVLIARVEAAEGLLAKAREALKAWGAWVASRSDCVIPGHCKRCSALRDEAAGKTRAVLAEITTASKEAS